MSDGFPTVCIGLPVRNGEAFLGEALDSLLGQTYGDFEIVISDNASGDGTGDLCRAYAERDRRIRYARTDRNIGAGPNFRRVFGFCRSPLFKWMAHDDVLAPTWLERCVALLDADPGAVLAHTAVRMVDGAGGALAVGETGRILDEAGRRLLDVEALHLAESDRPEERFRDALRRTTWCLAGLGLIRTAALRRTHGLGRFYGCDHVLLGELALLGRFRQCPEPLFLKRCHACISVHKTPRQRAEWLDPSRPAGLDWALRRLGYFRALGVAPLTPRQYLSCLATAARTSARNPLLHALLPYGLRSLPGLGARLKAGG